MKRILFTLLLLSTILLTACSEKIMGYSVVLWNIPEYGIASGDVVPVYIKSNISHVYVVGKTDGEKIEIPLWQITEPVKKGKVNSLVSKYADNAHTYASVKLDGLPCRAEPVNTAKQVYRLRKGEVIKILYKGKGQAPMAGKTALEGDWYKILTEDGTPGWCFSYNLNMYETNALGERVGGEEFIEEVEEDTRWNTIITRTWYPDSFKNMISSGNIDLTKLHPSYKFTIDTENNKVSLNTSTIHETWDFEGYTKTDEYEYTLKNIAIKITYRNMGYIVVRYTDDSGKPQDLDFVVIDSDISEVITNEKNRRSVAYLDIWIHGPVYSSSNYGKITFNEDGVFHWSGYKLLVPSIIDAGTKNNGTAQVRYSLSKSLSASYDGVVSFKFEGMADEVHFLYKLEDGGLRMEDTTGATFDGNQIKSRGTSPVIIYFKTYRVN